MGVDLGGADVAVAQEFLDGADIVAAFQQMGGKGVAEGVAAGPLCDAGEHDGVFDGTLDYGFVHVVAAFLPGRAVAPAASLGEEPLPAPVAGGVGVLLCNGTGQQYVAPAFGQVFFVECFHQLQVFFEGFYEGSGQHGDPVFCAFAAFDCYAAGFEIQVLDAHGDAFVEPEATAVHDGGHESGIAGHEGQDGFDFRAGHDYRQMDRLLGPYYVSELAGIDAQDPAVHEQEGGKCLVLGGGGDVILKGKVGQKGVYFGFNWLSGLVVAADCQVQSYPVQVGFFGSGAVMQGAHGVFAGGYKLGVFALPIFGLQGGSQDRGIGHEQLFQGVRWHGRSWGTIGWSYRRSVSRLSAALIHWLAGYWAGVPVGHSGGWVRL